jgi:uncharacterized alpha-E superfamily protein
VSYDIFVYQSFRRELFFSVTLPLRWFAQRAGSLTSIVSAAGVWYVRRKSWPVLLKMVMGVENYRFKVPSVDPIPRNVAECLIKYEDMPKDAERRAMVRRSAWVARHFEEASQTFAKLALTAADLASLLRKVEEDQTLVHAAYYTDDKCIARIADWIADGQ